jgi:predicted CoA-binding protein
MKKANRLREILQNYQRIAVVGLSNNPERPSHQVASYLLRHGYNVIPVNPSLTEVLGRRCYPSLRDIPGGVDMVDCFRKPEDLAAVVEDTIAIGARCLWLQLGVAETKAIQRAEDHGIEVIVERCIKIEHAHLLG